MADQNEGEMEVQKTVTIVGYLKDQSWSDWREWSDAQGDNRDYYEKDTHTETSHLLKGRGFEKEISEDEYHTLKNNHTGELQVVRETKESESYRWAAKGEKKLITKPVMGSVVDSEFLQDYEKGFSYGWSRDDGEKILSIWTSAQNMGLLKHPSEMNGGDPWEDEDADLMAVKFRVNIKNVQEDLADKLNEEATENIIDGLKEHEQIGRVRWTDCETKKVEKGACYNI